MRIHYKQFKTNCEIPTLKELGLVMHTNHFGTLNHSLFLQSILFVQIDKYGAWLTVSLN